ncbi:MAG: flagellar hook-basal body complex protein FliE [Phycisphaerales bacterium]|nr:flagellar hook-basal body complex protein FliE [Phycisphaerales bacterium]
MGVQSVAQIGLPGVGPLPAAGGAGARAVPEKSFKDVMVDSLNEVNRLQKEADAGVQRLLTGETDQMAEVFAASNKAGIAFDMLMEVRNRLVEAYREIQQMRV